MLRQPSIAGASAGRDDGDGDGLAVADLTVAFGGLTAISGVSLVLRRREIFGLIGPNGAGKTTLVNCLTGFQRPTSGRIMLGGKEVTSRTPAQLRHAGIARTFQAGRLFKDMTVLENVEVAAVGMGMTRRAAEHHALDLLDRLELSDRAEQLAGGLPYTDERRLGIARALVASPTFILLDEPAAGMSDPESERLMEIVEAIPRLFGCGVLLIEHNIRVVMGVCQRVHVLDGGRTIGEGTPREIQQDQAVIAAYLGDSAKIASGGARGDAARH